MIQHLNKMLPNLNLNNTEIAIAAMLCFDYGDFDDIPFVDTNPFDPPPPPPGWREDCGSRMTPCPMSTKVIYMLVERLGGLQNIRDPSIFANLAR